MTRSSGAAKAVITTLQWPGRGLRRTPADRGHTWHGVLMRYLGLMRSYRGQEGSWAWMFHRISGIAVWAFVVLHIIDIYLAGGDPHAYDELLAFYASPVGRVMEILLGAALLYHALNGMRILIIDLWPAMTVHHRKLWWGSWVIFFGLGIPGAIIILRPYWKDALDGVTGMLRITGVM